MNERLLAFQEAYRNLELLPLLDQEKLEKFRIDYGRNTLEELEQLIEDSPSGNSKIIFAGHRGCGKSTLLAELSQKLNPHYFIVFFSISDLIEMSDVNHVNILFAIAVQLMAEAEQRQIKIKDSIKKQFYQWFAERTKIETEQFSAETSAGFDFLKILTGKLKADAKVRYEIKEQFLRQISELIARIDEIAAVIFQSIEKEVLVIIDDLDKLDLALVQEVYQYHIKALFQPSFRIIFTVPVSALRDVRLSATLTTETNDQIVTMPVSKLFAKNQIHDPGATPDNETLEKLTIMLDKRLASDLIEPEIVKQIVIYSGGVLRELIRLSNECCRICLRLIRRNPDNQEIKINAEVLQKAVNEIRLDFDTRLGKTDYEILIEVYQNFRPDDPKDQNFLDLLHGLYALEYRNAELWYDVHPIVYGLLHQRGLLS